MHLIERRSDLPIEVQLRTPEQHRWAEEVERVELRSRHALKDGKGPKVLQRYYFVRAEIMAAGEAGYEVDPALVTEMHSLTSELDQTVL